MALSEDIYIDFSVQNFKTAFLDFVGTMWSTKESSRVDLSHEHIFHIFAAVYQWEGP